MKTRIASLLAEPPSNRRHAITGGAGASAATPRRASLALGLALALGLFLSFAAPRAQASLGFETYWGSISTGVESTGGRFSNTGPKGVAVYEATGDVYAADAGFNRVQQFDEDGNFIRAWGFDVVAPEASPPSSGSFETCTVKTQCKSGITAVSPAQGGELSNPTDIDVDQSNGHVYVANAGMLRIEEFTSTGGFVRAFGRDVVASGSDQADEEQRLTVNATAGQYKLTFGGNTTTDIEWNEPATGVEAKLNALASINAGGGSVTVAGGPGAPGGSTPYAIKFGGARADTNLSAITVAAGTVALTGTATIATLNDGAVGFEICNAAASCKAGVATGATGGALGAVSNLVSISVSVVPSGGTAPNAGNLLVADPTNRRIQEFSPTGAFIRAFGWSVVASGPDKKEFSSGPDRADAMWTVVVRATGGDFKLSFGGDTTTALPFNASSTQVQAAFNALPSIAGSGGAVTVTGGAGNATGSTPFVVTFDGGSLAGAVVEEEILGVNASLSGGITTSNVFTFRNTWGGEGFEVCRAGRDICKVGEEGSGVGQFLSSTPTAVVEDLNGRIYSVEREGSATPNASPPNIATAGFRVQSFTLPGNVPTPQGSWLCEVLCGTGKQVATSNTPMDIATDGGGNVYVAKAFLNGTGTPPVEQPPSSNTSKYQERILKIDPAGNGGLGQVVETINANSGQEPAIEGVGGVARVEGISGIASTASGDPLYVATSSSVKGTGYSRVYRLGEISGPSGSVATTTVGATAVELDATIVPAETTGPVTTRYRFEYRPEGVATWTRSPSADIDIGNGSAGGESSACSSALQAAICHISGEIDGLEVGLTYQYRLVARTSYQGATFTTAPQEFTTGAVPPSAVTGSAVWGGPPSTGPSLTFNGRINPQGGNTTYAFEYVSQADFDASGFANAEIAPAAPISAGHGSKTLDIVVARNGLDASSAYRFRLVASNAAGTSTGDAHSVAASHAGDRFIELVSAGDSQGSDVAAMPTVSDDGERVAFTALSFGSDQQAAPWIINPAISQRGASGWVAKAVTGDPLGNAALGFDSEGNFGDAEVTQRLWGIKPAPQTVQLAVRKLDGALTPISSVISPLDRTGSFSLKFLGGSNDLSTLVFSNGSGGSSTLFPGEPLLSGGASNLYKVSGAGTGNPNVTLLNAAGGGGVIGGACGAVLGAGESSPRTNAVSADGSVAYFSARAGTPAGGSCTTAAKMRIFKRVGSGSPVEVDQSQCARVNPDPVCSTDDGDDFFWGASADGSKVFFSSVRQLTSSDTDSTEDLYLYDSSPPSGQPNLVQVSAGELVADSPAHAIGNGADVQGVADISMDGSRVYFVAKGRLTADAAAGANNLYVFQRDDGHSAGRIDLVAGLAPGVFQAGSQDDPRLWGPSGNSTGGYKPAYALPRYEGGGTRVDGDGHVFLFVSSRPLLPAEDQDSVNDLYRYDDEAPPSERLACPSCTGDGAMPVDIIGHDVRSAMPDRIQRERVASEDGSQVVFRTREQLLPAVDTNTAEDVYLWDEGTLSLISGATGEVGVSYAEEGGGPSISPDGRTVFFAARATLLPQDLDNGAIDIYAARVDGGFLQEETVPPCAAADACRTVLPPPAPNPQSPATNNFTGSGNVKTKKCAKKKVLRNGKCVKKQKHKNDKNKSGKGKKKSRDGSGRRAGR